MAEAAKVYICDCCNRVAARLEPDGTLVIHARHGQDWHETKIRLTASATPMHTSGQQHNT